jgi:hypothetical protein
MTLRTAAIVFPEDAFAVCRVFLLCTIPGVCQEERLPASGSLLTPSIALLSSEVYINRYGVAQHLMMTLGFSGINETDDLLTGSQS